ncbi:MAG: desulfoferrodoxin FeS4 iron-binding domain-containing protein [Bacillota bacterium]|nr:desulfoferrodoxin FeS4 iron-binding domain-containing protein [Bacillota bacterium]MDW7683924.1 desulfoferrodoxin FeS4 iron-binding domain-containing protein [Bacillota bacterium]
MGTAVDEVYVCEICGNTVRVLKNGAGTLVCCGEPMKKEE